MPEKPKSHAAVATSAVTFVETEHGRERRRQRGIDKKNLKEAVKHGERQEGKWKHKGHKTAVYRYKGITYIRDKTTGEEVTSWAEPLKLDRVPISDVMQKEYQQAVSKIQSNKDAWLSNTVIVIDISGSMREADIWGARTRLAASWIAIALDFLAHRLETGAASAMDVMSVVTMGEDATIVLKERPSSWVLYNQIVKIYSQYHNSPNAIVPRGHGFYLPSLETAEELLTTNMNASCALLLTFLSDGRPSDSNKQLLIDRVGHLAKRFGRRLNFEAIGIGDLDNFDTLQAMVDAATDYGAVANFRLPSMTSMGIGDAFSLTATSVTITKTEMTDVITLKQRKVRDVLRESRMKAALNIEHVSQEDFFIYPRNRVKRTIYKEWYEGRKRHSVFEEAPLQNPEAEFVAIHREAFGEGAERIVFRFYEVADDGGTIIGRPLVAKESRLVLDEHQNENERKKFVRTFCETQQISRRLAEKFNEKVGGMPAVDPKTPKVTFLDCSIYQLDDLNIGKQSVLVEERLDESKWFKWNANNGYVEGAMAPKFDEAKIREAVKKLDALDLDMDMMDIIVEGSEDEEESSDEDEDGRGSLLTPVLYTPSEVAQAFSHFSYLQSSGKRLVCDLQGVFDEKENVLRFSDPAIHYYNHLREERRMVHGRTDRGRKGVAMFFDTHTCCHLCTLSVRGFRGGKKKWRKPLKGGL